MYHRNPRHAPTIAPHRIASSSAPTTCGISRYFAQSDAPTATASSMNEKLTIAVHPLASPSSPSVKFTALLVPAITSTAVTMNTPSGIVYAPSTPFRNGMYSLW